MVTNCMHNVTTMLIIVIADSNEAYTHRETEQEREKKTLIEPINLNILFCFLTLNMEIQCTVVNLRYDWAQFDCCCLCVFFSLSIQLSRCKWQKPYDMLYRKQRKKTAMY